MLSHVGGGRIPRVFVLEKEVCNRAGQVLLPPPPKKTGEKCVCGLFGVEWEILLNHSTQFGLTSHGYS